jgi:hypothetical protein
VRGSIALDDLFEDLFGLSFRAGRSIYTAFRRPADYYAAARDRTWQDRFTPSVRLWLSLFAVLSFLQFIWLRTDSALVALTASQITEAGLAPPEGMSVDELSQKVYATAYAAYPLLALVLLTVGGLLFPFWGRGHDPGTRVRSIFVTVVPSAVAALVILVLTTWFTPGGMSNFAILATLIAILFDFATASRGAFPDSSRAGRIVRALALALWIAILNLLLSAGSSLVALTIVTIQTGVPLI